jgi:putative transposase
MLTDEEFLQWGRRLALPDHARTLVAHIRSEPPSRRVRGAAGNVSGRYPSRKMGWTVQAESHTVELGFVRAAEHDAAVLEYYDQPPTIWLRYRTRDGRQVRPVAHTPDFFVLWHDSAGWVECKDDTELRRLETHNPHRYCRDDAGRWRCPPGEQYAATVGLRYRVYSSADVNWVWQDNLDFLQDYLRAGPDLVSDVAAREIETLVAATPGLSITQVLDHLGGATADDLYALIAAGRLYVDLSAVRLADRAGAAVYLDEALAPVHRIVGAGAARVSPPSDPVDRDLEAPMSADGRERMAGASTADRREANRRYALIAPYLAGQHAAADGVAGRTRRRWLKAWRDAEHAYGQGYVGLLPRSGRQGNRTAKLPAETLTLQEEFIATHYETLAQRSVVAVWGLLANACAERGLIAPSYTTFRRAVKCRPRYEQTLKRQGRRAASAYEEFHWELAYTLPRHGNRPLAIAHLDHTELDIELICSRTGQPLGRPWASFLVDAFTRRILAVYVSYHKPSTMACMMALRLCVQRHGRLPQTLVVDGAPEFRSTHFETLLAAYEVTKKTRPWAKPHFGSTCERLVGTTNTRFVHTLIGNTQIMTNVRQVTKAVDPKKQACWTYADLYAHLCDWAYEIYDTTPHAALGQSPREAFVVGERLSGARAHKRIQYDEDFHLWTLPSTRAGTALVQPGHGVKINYLTYWCEDFRDPRVERTRVEVRYVPWDVSQAYAYVHGRWAPCISCYRARFEGHSTSELLLVAEEMRQRDRLHARAFPLTAKRLAEALAAREAHEALLLQRRRDA